MTAFNKFKIISEVFASVQYILYLRLKFESRDYFQRIRTRLSYKIFQQKEVFVNKTQFSEMSNGILPLRPILIKESTRTAHYRGL